MRRRRVETICMELSVSYPIWADVMVERAAIRKGRSMRYM
jgi:hypothetical protein